MSWISFALISEIFSFKVLPFKSKYHSSSVITSSWTSSEVSPSISSKTSWIAKDGVIEKNKIKVQDIINSTYEKYTKEEAQDKKDQIKGEILEELSEMFDTETIVDISFGSIMYQ